MGFLKKAKALLKDDWCKKCTEPMQLEKKQLYTLPMTVGHYVQHDDPNYYQTNLIKVNKKADIPTGFYACGAYLYHCPHCGKKVVKLTIFLPVRDQEQFEDVYLFENGEMNDFVLNS